MTDTPEPIAFLRGRFVPQAQASLALHDAGFVFGATVTDLCRTFGHQLFRWDEHLARFRRSCEAVGIEVPLDDAAIGAAARELVAHNSTLIDPSDDLALVVIGTPGLVGYYAGEPGMPGDAPTFGMHTFPLPFSRYRSWIGDGVVLMTPSVRAVPAVCVDPHIKQRSRIHWWLAEREVRRLDKDAQALLLDVDGHVTETASSNLLVVKNGAILAPPRDAVLDGISLGFVVELCERQGIAIDHRPLTMDECYGADEVLLTCTSYCLAGVRRINDRAIRWPGPVLERLRDAWSAEVGLDIHRQIMASA